MTLYTIGHSTRPLDDFLALLAREGIAHLADVRAFPASRRHPHYNREALAASLAEHGIAYSHRPELGGRRTPRPDSPNRGWRNAGFRGYADYIETPAFEAALDALLSTAASARTTVMCAEAVPWRCHRTLIADAAAARGEHVLHILDAAVRPHVLTKFAVVREGRVRYPGDGADVDQAELFAADEVAGP